MEYTKLLKVDTDKKLELPYFPNNFYGAVFRLWDMCGAERLARAFSVEPSVIEKAAADMGLPQPQCPEVWAERGYLSVIRSAWHILPYSQLLKLLDMSEERLAEVLKNEDFFDVKLGNFKPYCEEIKPLPLDAEGKKRLERIRSAVTKYFSGMSAGARPFDFFKKTEKSAETELDEDIRLIYSYCGLYASVLDNDISKSYPDELLQMYRATGVNAVWLPVLLQQMGPFPFDESLSEGWQLRRERLSELVKKAGTYGIKVYLYVNEPRCLPLNFFENHPELLGSTQYDMYGALCTSVPAVMDYLYDAVKDLCENVRGIGGFFAITCSEYLTHCKSRFDGTECPRCKDIPTYELVSGVLRTISEASRAVDPGIRTIAWTWAWDEYMTREEINKCIDLIPGEVIIQSNSEVRKEFCIGGINGDVQDYSMSIPGPGTLARQVWEYAKNKGHETSAKVQVNVTWECSTVPFLPVFDLVREHMTALKKEGVSHVMLSWTLGGYPSVNLKVATGCLIDPSREKYMEILKAEYGEYAEKTALAATRFSDAFREFPFHIYNLYMGPQNGGPSNLLFLKPSGFGATMTCYAFDDIDVWRAIYPRDVYINQLKKLSEGWKEGLEIIRDMPECDFTQVAEAAYDIFRSSYLQSEFINIRENAEPERLKEIIAEEKQLALSLYGIMLKNSLVGYEAANHYYYTKAMLAEKVINCEYLEEQLEK